VPVVLITAQSGPENTAAGFAGGVTDYSPADFRKLIAEETENRGD
jgi:hypothetical protein